MDAILAALSAGSRPEKDLHAGLSGPASPHVTVTAPARSARGQEPEREEAVIVMARLQWRRHGSAAEGRGFDLSDFASMIRNDGIILANNRLRDVAEGRLSAEEARTAPGRAPGPEPAGPEEPEENAGPPTPEAGDPRIIADMVSLQRRLSREISSYENNLVARVGLTAEQSRGYAMRDLNVSARVTAGVRTAMGVPDVTETGEPVPMPAAGLEIADRIMTNLKETRVPVVELRRDEVRAPDSAPGMRSDRYEERMDEKGSDPDDPFAIPSAPRR